MIRTAKIKINKLQGAEKGQATVTHGQGMYARPGAANASSRLPEN